MGNIHIIGPQASGKTTYLAALAYQPPRARQKNKNFKVQALNEETRELADKAENIILEGASLEPTQKYVKTIDDLKVYSFIIEIQKKWRKLEKINLAVRDYPGEVFKELESVSTNPLHEEFMNECLSKDTQGCLILLTEWKQGTDKFYKRVFKRLINLMDKQERLYDLRLAVAMSKCERGELWPGRLDPENDLFAIHFPETLSFLKDNIPPKNLQFYAISTFGVLGSKNPRPNRKEELGTKGRYAVLRETDSWSPYGMISPLYWLSTGKRMREDV
jgi:adenylate kinase family enzyme